VSLTAYLARPIDLSSLTGAQSNHLAFVEDYLLERGVVVFKPAGAFAVPPETPPHGAIQDINRYALERSDLLVALYPEAVGVGTAMELEYARAAKKPILVVTDVAHKSWSLAGVPKAVKTQFPTGSEVEAVVAWAHLAQTEREKDGAAARPVLKFQLDDDAKMPTRGYAGDAGYDLYVQEDIVIGPDAFADVPMGCAVELPPGVWGFITGRSSTLRKHNLLVTTGIIDTGYRGPLFAGVKNLDFNRPFTAEKGTRLAQLIPLPNLADGMLAVEAQTLDPSERGTAGFGSSGH
jgi:dUTP pyrophosphatase